MVPRTPIAATTRGSQNGVCTPRSCSRRQVHQDGPPLREARGPADGVSPVRFSPRICRSLQRSGPFRVSLLPAGWNRRRRREGKPPARPFWARAARAAGCLSARSSPEISPERPGEAVRPGLPERKTGPDLHCSWSGWPDLNRRPLRPERSALPSCATPRAAQKYYPTPGPTRNRYPPKHKTPGQRGINVSTDASGRQLNRIGAVGWVPNPADTCSHESDPGHRCSPLAIDLGRSQLVVSAP